MFDIKLGKPKIVLFFIGRFIKEIGGGNKGRAIQEENIFSGGH